MYITYEELVTLDIPLREVFINTLVNKLKEEFEFVHWQGLLPMFLHKKTEMEFVFIPCSTFNMGFSLQEEENTKMLLGADYRGNLGFDPSEMRPVHKVTLNPFLISKTPVLYKLTDNLIFNFSDIYKKHYESYKRDYELYKDDGYSKVEYIPVLVQKEEAENIAKTVGCRLPFEAEWEYCCRARSNTLFFWGNTLPDEEILDGYLDNRFFNLQEDQANDFGLYGLFIGEWCKDQYCNNYSSTINAEEDCYVVRGQGGASSWQWQSNEWIFCLSAMRMGYKKTSEVQMWEDEEPKTVTLTTHFRLVYDLSE